MFLELTIIEITGDEQSYGVCDKKYKTLLELSPLPNKRCYSD